MKKWLWLVVILSLFTATFFNQLNLNQLPQELIRDGETVVTSDDWSYLGPATNYYKTGVWKNNIPGKIAYFSHTPGYGSLYYCCLLLNETHALLLLKTIQIILFSLSVYCLFHIGFNLLKNELIAFIITVIYGLTPFATGFLYYTLTEGITPALTIFYLYFLTKAFYHQSVKHENIFFGLAALVFAYLFVTRPVLVVFGLLLPVVIYKSYSKPLKKIVLFGAIASSLMVLWQIRNYNIADKYVGIYPIYYADNNSIYRPTLESFWDFNKSWGVEGHVYHSYSLPFWTAAIKGDTSISHIHFIIDNFPKYVVDFYGKDRLTNVFRNYQKAILVQKQYYDKGIPMPEYKIPEEQLVVNQFKALTTEFKNEFWFQYHVISPLKVFKVMAFHSNLSPYLFQVTLRGNIIMEFFRLLFFSLHVLCFLALLLNIICFKWNTVFLNSLFLPTFIYVLFLCYFQRGIEERYTLPLIPILLIALFNIILLSKAFLKQKQCL